MILWARSSSGESADLSGAVELAAAGTLNAHAKPVVLPRHLVPARLIEAHGPSRRVVNRVAHHVVALATLVEEDPTSTATQFPTNEVIPGLGVGLASSSPTP